MAHSGLVKLGLVLGLTLACRNTQRVPGPIWLADDAPREREPLRAGVGIAATVVRHSGPVRVQRPGAPAGHALAFFDKRARLEPGGSVLVGQGGRAELFWPGSPTSVVLLGRGEAEVGDPRSDLPLVRLRHVSRAQFILGPTDRVALPGGLELRGDDAPSSGPFLAEHLASRVLRIKNQSKQEARVAFRGRDLQLLPGDAMEVPLLGEAVLAPPPSGRLSLLEGDQPIESTGRVAATPEAGGLRLQALEPAVVLVGGVRVHLAQGEGFLFSSNAPQTPEPAPQSPTESRE